MKFDLKVFLDVVFYQRLGERYIFLADESGVFLFSDVLGIGKLWKYYYLFYWIQEDILVDIFVQNLRNVFV